MYKFKIIELDKKKQKNLYLDFISLNDVELIRSWRNNQMSILRQSAYITKRDQIEYFKKVVSKEIKNKYPKLIIFSIRENNKTIGYCGFVNISWQDNRAEISFLLDDKLKFKKKYNFIMKFVFNELFEIGFKKIGFKKIFTETFASRKQHLLILKELKMRKEGILKKQYNKNQKLIDSILHARFNDI